MGPKVYPTADSEILSSAGLQQLFCRCKDTDFFCEPPNSFCQFKVIAMVATAAASLVQVPLVQSRASTRPARRTVYATQASAEVPRRQALSAAAGAALLLFSGVAQAKVGIPFQDSMRKSGSSSEASMGGYGMEGTKKRALPKGSRTKTFDALREKAASALQAATK